MAAPQGKDYSGHDERGLLVEIAQTSAATAATVEAIKERMDRDDEVTREHSLRIAKVESRLDQIKWLGRAAGAATLAALAEVVKTVVGYWHR